MVHHFPKEQPNGENHCLGVFPVSTPHFQSFVMSCLGYLILFSLISHLCPSVISLVVAFSIFPQDFSLTSHQSVLHSVSSLGVVLLSADGILLLPFWLSLPCLPAQLPSCQSPLKSAL